MILPMKSEISRVWKISHRRTTRERKKIEAKLLWNYIDNSPHPARRVTAMITTSDRLSHFHSDGGRDVKLDRRQRIESNETKWSLITSIAKTIYTLEVGVSVPFDWPEFLLSLAPINIIALSTISRVQWKPSENPTDTSCSRNKE